MLEELLQDRQELVRRVRDVVEPSDSLCCQVPVQLRHALGFGFFDRATKGVPGDPESQSACHAGKLPPTTRTRLPEHLPCPTQDIANLDRVIEIRNDPHATYAGDRRPGRRYHPSRTEVH
jgi:hypothetical protein